MLIGSFSPCDESVKFALFQTALSAIKADINIADELQNEATEESSDDDDDKNRAVLTTAAKQVEHGFYAFS